MDSLTYEQFEIPLTQIKEQLGFMAENSEVEIDYFRETPISIELPIKMTFEVINAPPAVRGNSAGAITKTVKISTGKELSAPIFIKIGDKIVVDTRNGSYVERAN
ncbi:MAG: elongation factor P [Candidatus Berkelbacteria bacterium Athens1014_28]|uniref:Elongation factor P n=1 Tax=Candidatus Berkelbacteria bacterium Athens1014_28 TaxID=2017145 RepID=A0A554LIX4_9BACT|nr:MAG: elongation factor P [Candidatus Berkelbacteria bacterium Athens1014_28]